METSSSDTTPDTALERAVRVVGAVEVVDMVFAASLRPAGRTFRLGHMLGARAGSMDGLVTDVGQGLGGKALALDRPLAVEDYAHAEGITHQFDQAVAAEGLHAVFAVPIRVEGELCGAVYGAARRRLDFGERFLRGIVDTVRAAARPRPPAVPRAGAAPDVVLCGEEARELHAVLRSARAAADPATRSRLDRLTERLYRRGDGPVAEAPPVRLSDRELDVLAVVALGCGNAEVAQQLSLRVETVKSYLKSAMAKLDSHTRSGAVHQARRVGLLP